MKRAIAIFSFAALAMGATLSVFGEYGTAFYANDFTLRTSGETPSDRWMETAYIPGALARSVASISSEGREPYSTATGYQDGWAMKAGYCRSSVLFTVADDGGNQGALVNANSSSYQNNVTVAMQPFYNEFTSGLLKISVDIRTPAQTNSFNPSSNACATFAPLYKSALEPTSSTFSAPMHFGPTSLYDNTHDRNAWLLRAVTRGRITADSAVAYFGQYDGQNDIAAGSWVRYEAVLDLDSGTYTATFANLGTAHPTPSTAGGSPVAFRQEEDDASPTKLTFMSPVTAQTGGIAGLAFYVQGVKQATDTADAPMFDNIAVSWKAPGAADFVSVYENDFSTRRYRQIEPVGTTSGTYVPVLTTNIVQSSFYERASINNDYGVKEDSARRLVPDGDPYLGQDGWRRIAGGAYFTMVDPNKDSDGYGWNNASVLRATGSDKTGMVAAPLGTTVSSGKVRLYCDILMGALTNSTSQTRDISAAAFLAGDGAFTNTCFSSTRLRVADVTTALRNKGVCGAGTCYSDRAKDAYQTNTRLYRFNGSSYGSLRDTDGNYKYINCGRWERYIVTLDLDAGKFDVAIYNLGYVGQPMNFDHTTKTLEFATNNLSLAVSAIRNVDSVVLFSEGQDNYNGKTTSFNGKALGRFPLFDNVRVCLVNDDGTDGTELYACNFEYGYRMSVQNATSLVGNADREGADRWIRRGNSFGTISAVDAGGDDNVVVLDNLGWIGSVTRAGYAVQSFGAVPKGCSSVDFVADIRPPYCFARSSDCFAYVEVGGDAYAQGVYRPASGSNWRREPRIGFGFSVGAGANAVKQYTNVVLTVQTVASSGGSAVTTTANHAIDKSHWYRFRVKANQKTGTFAVNVYDQGTAKPAADDADGMLVATFEDLSLPAFGGEGMTTFGLAGAGFCGSFGGRLDDPYVGLIDNLSASAVMTFAAFLDEYGLPPNTAPLFVTNGIPLIARYVYGIVPLTARTDINGRPLVDIKINANGPVFELAPQKNPDEYGLEFSLLASPTLTPWTVVGEYPFDPATGLCIPDLGTPAPPCMFFKWCLTIAEE